MKNLKPLSKTELKTVMGGDKCSCQNGCPWKCRIVVDESPKN